MKSPKLLTNILKRDGSNFDLFRLIAALGVIFGHAYYLVPTDPVPDTIRELTNFDYAGSLAVKFFFFLSGMLVTNSIISKPNAFHFLIKRACRIFPGLLVCLLFSVLVVGPIFTKLPLKEYLSAKETWTYLTRNFYMIDDFQWKLTGVFSDSIHGLNGSIWTLPYECLCYIYLAIFFGLGFLRHRITANIFFSIAIGVALIMPQYLPGFFAGDPKTSWFPGLFALGALAATNKDLIPVSLGHAVLLWLLAYVLKNTASFQFVFYVALFYTIIFVASRPFVVNSLKLPFDASYGVYIYGYMIQQCLHFTFPSMGIHGNQAWASLIAIFIGFGSWYLVEKPFIMFGERISQWNPAMLSWTKLPVKKAASFEMEKTATNKD